MERIDKQLNWEAVTFLALFVLGLVIRGINRPEWFLFSFLGMLQTLLFIGLIAAWCTLTRRRLIQNGIRKNLTAVCLFLILWFLFRGLKYYVFQPGTDAARCLWYAYYVPMMFYPACAANAMTYIGRPDNWTQPPHARLLFVIPACLSVLVLTNDLHQLVFTFPENGRIWSDMAYGYGVLYVLPFGWTLLCVSVTFVLMIRRCRIPKSRSAFGLLPLVPLFLGICYNIAYVSGSAYLPFLDLIITMSFLTVLTFELAIRLGYIRSNSHYQEVFRLSSAAAQILDDRLNPRYVSNSFSSYNRDDVLTAIGNGYCIRGSMRMTAEPISGGYVVWREDLGELIRIQQQLESANEYLEDRHMVLMRNYETRVRIRKLEEQNRLVNEMQNQTKDKLDKLNRLLQCFEADEAGSEDSCLLSIGVITVYLKRRNNLIFLAETGERFPVSELRNCINETILLLETFGITGILHITAEESLTFEEIVRLYDVFETVIEETCTDRPVYFVTVTSEEGRVVLRIRISGIRKLPDRILREFRIAEEDGEYMIIWKETHVL